MTSDRELWEALLPVVDALVALAVPYYVGGIAWPVVSRAWSRATLDVDLVAAYSTDRMPRHLAASAVPALLR